MAEPEISSADEALLAAIAVRRKRDLSVLTAWQEQLVDDWRAGRLPPAQAEEAERLVRTSAAAAERVLERQLMEAAEDTPPISAELEARILERAAAGHESAVPAGVTARILPKMKRALLALKERHGRNLTISFSVDGMPERPSPGRYGFRWLTFGMWQWSGLASGAAAVAAVLVIGVQQFTADAPIRVAMGTVRDRDVLFETSDVRMRGAQPEVAADRRFRDVEIPVETVRRLIEVTDERSREAAARAVFPFLSGASEAVGAPASIVIDAALPQKLAAAGDRKLFTVRVYNLEDARSGNVRANLEPHPPTGQTYFLTVRP